MTEARVDQLRTLGFASIGATYSPLGNPLSHNWRIWKFTNNTNGDVFVSFDGVGDNLFVPANSFTLYDISTNSDQDSSVSLNMSIGTQYFVRFSSAPSSGSVYLEGIYQKGQ
jgi:hypothetical protein